jgi:hypothetical protein
MAFKMKSVRADKFERNWQSAKVRRIIDNTLTAEARNIKIDLQVTTQTWSSKNKPKFRIQLSGRYARTISTDSQIYAWVNDGTDPHPIMAKRAPMLRFQVGYTPKTMVGQIMSRAGGSSGSFAMAKVVQHPGTEARGFDKAIAEKWNDLFPAIIERAFLAELV